MNYFRDNSQKGLKVLALVLLVLIVGVPGAQAATLPPTNDPLYTKQGYLSQTGVPAAWNYTAGSSRTTIAIVDTGVDVDHPDLRNNIWVNTAEIPGDSIDNDSNGYVDDINGWDFVNEIPDPNPKFSDGFSAMAMQHGTLVAGIAAAVGNNKLGVSGVSWRTKIMPLRALNNRGEGDAINVSKAIDYAVAKKVDVINLSFVGDINSSFLQASIEKAYKAGIVVVAAAGNDSSAHHGVNLDKTPLYPVCYNKTAATVIGVGSVDALGQKSTYSHYGGCVDVSVPGDDYFTTQMVSYERLGFDSFYGAGWSGTSLSAGLVSGVAALLKSVNNKFTPDEILGFMKTGCESIDNLNPLLSGKLGCGRMNAEHAVKAAADTLRQALMDPILTNPGGAANIAVEEKDGKRPLMFFTAEGKKTGEFYPFWPHKVPYSITRSLQGDDKMVIGAGQGGGPHVRIYKRDSKLLGQFFAYDSKFRGGVSVALGDVDGDGEEEIVTAPGPGGGPHIKVFDQKGNLKAHFFAYASTFRYGLKVMLADVDNDGMADIIVTPIGGNSSDIRIFDGKGLLRGQFFAYDKTTPGGISIAAGDFGNDGSVEIVASPMAPGRGSDVRIFTSAGKLKKSFSPYGTGFSGGISLAIADLNHDAKPEIITVPASNGGAHVRIFSQEGAVLGQFFALEPGFRGGLRVGVIN